MKLDVNKLTLGELAKLEELSGQSVSVLGEEHTPKVKLLAALVFVQSKRDGQPKTWAQCLAMQMDEVSEYLGLNDDEDDDPLTADISAQLAAEEKAQAGKARKPRSTSPARKTSRNSSSTSASASPSTGS